MTTNAPLTPSADLARTMPESAAARLDVIDSALHSLAGERRRLERLGFELPLARCDRQIRFWKFAEGLFSIAGYGGRHPVERP